MRTKQTTAKIGLPNWLNGQTAVLVAIFGLLLTAYLDLRAEFRDVRAEIAALGSDLRAEIADLRTEVRSEIASVRSELGADIAQLRTELHDFRAEVRADIARLDAGQRALAAEVGKLREDMHGLEERLRAVEVRSASGEPSPSVHRADESSRTADPIGAKSPFATPHASPG